MQWASSSSEGSKSESSAGFSLFFDMIRTLVSDSGLESASYRNLLSSFESFSFALRAFSLFVLMGAASGVFSGV